MTQSVRQAVQPSPIDQIKVQLSKSLKDGADTLSVQLHPDDLGRVDVKLEMQNGQVKATVTADRPETLQLLKNDASVLQQSLNSAGLSTDANSLSFQLRGEQQQQQQQSAQNESGRYTASTVDAVEEDAASAALASAANFQLGNSKTNGIDINV
jgi:flagellar hook-length control protein FliK